MNAEIISDMSMPDYLDIPAFSSSLAHKILTASPLHAWMSSVFNPKRQREDSSKMDIGSYAHACLLEGGSNALVVCDFADWRTNAAKEMRDGARASGKLPILADKVADVEEMVSVARDYIERSQIACQWPGGHPEETVLWDEDGLACKARPDWLPADRSINVHYKTSPGSAEPSAWIRWQLDSQGYDVAAALYERAILAACPEVGECRSIFLVQEQKAPYACCLVGLDPAKNDLAHRKVNRALEVWSRCMQTQRFPAYPTQICWAEPLPWQLDQMDEQEERVFFNEQQLEAGIPL